MSAPGTAWACSRSSPRPDLLPRLKPQVFLTWWSGSADPASPIQGRSVHHPPPRRRRITCLHPKLEEVPGPRSGSTVPGAADADGGRRSPISTPPRPTSCAARWAQAPPPEDASSCPMRCSRGWPAGITGRRRGDPPQTPRLRQLRLPRVARLLLPLCISSTRTPLSQSATTRPFTAALRSQPMTAPQSWSPTRGTGVLHPRPGWPPPRPHRPRDRRGARRVPARDGEQVQGRPRQPRSGWAWTRCAASSTETAEQIVAEQGAAFASSQPRAAGCASPPVSSGARDGGGAGQPRGSAPAGTVGGGRRRTSPRGHAAASPSARRRRCCRG